VHDIDWHYFALALARVWLGIMIFAHGWRHLQVTRAGPGIANWFEGLGLKPGPVHAWNVTLTELGVGVVLILGFLTPVSYGALASLMLVAAITNHRKNGFFINNKPEGWEYVVTVAVVSVALGALGPGNWSLDHAFGFSFPFETGNALLITAAVALGGTAAFLAAFWRPPRDAAT
jgi:putative oxidoreductase